MVIQYFLLLLFQLILVKCIWLHGPHNIGSRPHGLQVGKPCCRILLFKSQNHENVGNQPFFFSCSVIGCCNNQPSKSLAGCHYNLPPSMKNTICRGPHCHNHVANAGFRLACRVIIACCFRVVALSGNAALALSPSSIAPELNWSQLSAICRGGQSGKVIDLLARRCLLLGHPPATSGDCAVVQISSSKRQCGERQTSLKAALNFNSSTMHVSTASYAG